MRKLNLQSPSNLSRYVTGTKDSILKNQIVTLKLLSRINTHRHLMDLTFIFFLPGNNVMQINQLLYDGVVHRLQRFATLDLVFNMMVTFLCQTQGSVHVI